MEQLKNCASKVQLFWIKNIQDIAFSEGSGGMSLDCSFFVSFPPPLESKDTKTPKLDEYASHSQTWKEFFEKSDALLSNSGASSYLSDQEVFFTCLWLEDVHFIPRIPKMNGIDFLYVNHAPHGLIWSDLKLPDLRCQYLSNAHGFLAPPFKALCKRCSKTPVYAQHASVKLKFLPLLAYAGHHQGWTNSPLLGITPFMLHIGFWTQKLKNHPWNVSLEDQRIPRINLLVESGSTDDTSTSNSVDESTSIDGLPNELLQSMISSLGLVDRVQLMRTCNTMRNNGLAVSAHFQLAIRENSTIQIESGKQLLCGRFTSVNNAHTVQSVDLDCHNFDPNGYPVSVDSLKLNIEAHEVASFKNLPVWRLSLSLLSATSTQGQDPLFAIDGLFLSNFGAIDAQEYHKLLACVVDHALHHYFENGKKRVRDQGKKDKYPSESPPWEDHDDSEAGP